MPSVDVAAPGTSSRRSAAAVSTRQRRAPSDQCNSDGHVEVEADAPGQPVRDDATEHQPEARADAGDGGVVGERAGALGLPRSSWSAAQASRAPGSRHRRPGSRVRRSATRGRREADGERGSVKSARPATNMRRRPRMSPARAPSSSNPPKASVYAFCTHESRGGRERESFLDLRQPRDDDRDVEHDHQVAHEDDREHRALPRCGRGSNIGHEGSLPRTTDHAFRLERRQLLLVNVLPQAITAGIPSRAYSAYPLYCPAH